MQGAITCTLLAPDLTEAGLFRADFLVVTAADYLNNTLQGVQRTRWSPDLVAATLDIGYAVYPRPCSPSVDILPELCKPLMKLGWCRKEEYECVTLYSPHPELLIQIAARSPQAVCPRKS